MDSGGGFRRRIPCSHIVSVTRVVRDDGHILSSFPGYGTRDTCTAAAKRSDLPESLWARHALRMTKLHSSPRRAAVLTADRLTMAEMAAHLGISMSTLRRQLRPTDDPEARALWAERLQLQQRLRGARLPVHHASKSRFLGWASVLRGEDPPVRV